MPSIIDAFYSLGAKINKLGNKDQDEEREGPSQELLPELELDMNDEDLAKLTDEWERSWNDSEVKNTWEKQADENEKYWKGEQWTGPKDPTSRPLQDNMVFEALETFLPQATNNNPEAMVEAKGYQPLPEDLEFAKMIQQKAADWADDIKLKMKLKKAIRHWAIYLVGVAEVGWDLDSDEPTTRIVRAKRLILDPEAIVDEDGYRGRFLGHRLDDEASLLIKKFPKKKEYITGIVNDKLGTNIKYIKWSTPSYVCWTLGKEVLGKMKNPHWNYDQEVEQQPITDEFGQETPQQPITQPGKNHFPVPAIPYVFLTIFNLGKQPLDETSLISQNLPQQDLINKRVKQIDKNVDSMNGGFVISGEKSGLTQEQAAQAIEVTRNGGAIFIPSGDPNEAVVKLTGEALPADVFNQLVDTRTRLRDIFGVSGSSAAGIKGEDTVRGKLMMSQTDTSRIGGGISEYLEQFADDIFNWYIQLLMVYEPQLFAQSAGKLKVSVKPGSLMPKDTVTQANQALELWNGGALDPITLFEKLDYPDPLATAKRLFLWKNAPQMLFENDPDIAAAMQMQQLQGFQQPQPAQPGQSPGAPAPSQPPAQLPTSASLSNQPINQLQIPHA